MGVCYDDNKLSLMDLHQMVTKFLPQNQTVKIPASTSGYGLSLDTATYSPYIATLSTTVAILQKLLDSEFEFILGGSRAMKKRGAAVSILPETDYDFYATYSYEIEKFLISLNFRTCVAREEYLDTEVFSIYKSEQIDIVLRKDAKFYKSVFDNIKTDMYVKHLWKRNPDCDRSKITTLFNEMFKIAREREKNKQELIADNSFSNTIILPDEELNDAYRIRAKFTGITQYNSMPDNIMC